MPPLAVMVVALPEQTVALADEEIRGETFTVTETIFVAEQLLLVPVIVYVIVEAGVAVTLMPVVTFNPVDGDHE